MLLQRSFGRRWVAPAATIKGTIEVLAASPLLRATVGLAGSGEVRQRRAWGARGPTVRHLAMASSSVVRFEGPSALAVQVARELAAADGIDLTASKPPVPLDHGHFALEMTVEATAEALSQAITDIDAELPPGARIFIVDP